MSNKVTSFLVKYASPIVLSIVLIGMIIAVKAGCTKTDEETLEKVVLVSETSARSITYSYIVTNKAGFVNADVAKSVTALSEAFIEAEKGLESGELGLENVRDTIVVYVNGIIDEKLDGNALIKQLATILIYDGFKRLEEAVQEDLKEADAYVDVLKAIRLGVVEGAKDAGVILG